MYTVRIVLGILLTGILLTLVLAVLLSADRRPTAGGRCAGTLLPPGNQALQAGDLFGTKLVLNEFVAFIELGAGSGLSAYSIGVVTFALCGFAHLTSAAWAGLLLSL